MNFQDLQEVMTSNPEFRCRVEKSTFRDKIYFGVFRKTLWDAGIGSDVIKTALKQGLIEEVQIAPVGSTARSGYVWLEKELSQVNVYKKAYALIGNFWENLKRRVRQFVRLYLSPRF